MSQSATITLPPIPPSNRKGDSIGTAFASLSTASPPLPERYGSLKKDLLKGREKALLEGWKRLIDQMEHETLPMIRSVGTKLVPEVDFAEIVANGGKLPDVVKANLKKCGTLVVRNVIPREQAIGWKQQVKDYINANPSTTGWPAGSIQVYNIFWSKQQLEARSHPNMLLAQAAMNGAWSSQPEDPVVLSETLAYADRLRIRTPGDTSFKLGPHLDGGSLERWEDNEYRRCYTEVLEGRWEDHDPFVVGPRLGATFDMHKGPGGCSIFRSFQGWLSLSDCPPGSGTLQVMPDVVVSTAYVIMRPFVKSDSAGSWDVDNSTSIFHGAAMGAGHELNAEEHPHLTSSSFVSIPGVHPGDAVFWHCDVAHMVEPEHKGVEDGTIFYIPILPLCDINTKYVLDQRASFLNGTPPIDFPAGIGESKHVGCGKVDDVGGAGRTAMGLDAFDLGLSKTPGEALAFESANRILGTG